VIPLLDLKAQYRGIKDEIEAAVLEVLRGTHYVLGEAVADFEQEFARFCGTGHAVAVNSGTSALHLSLAAIGIGPGDEVITVPFTFVATVATICYTGARPVLVDIDPRSYTIDPGQIEKAITKKTRAIIPVHLFGHPAEMDPILEIARARNLHVIEDAAQAHGAEYKGRRVGSLAELGCFSFYPSKILGACGEGGLVTTSNAELARKIRMLRNWGQEGKYDHVLQGFNYRMDGIQGAALGVKLRHLHKWIEGRRSRAALYHKLLDGFDVQRPWEAPHCRHIYSLYTICSDRREAIRNGLEEAGVETAIHYPIPVHLQKAYAALGYGPGAFPVSEKIASEILSLPIYPELTDAQVEKICSSIGEALQ
jgi:dTDP-4-amino-4,6-dideoxygalactose transaminase